ncbi:MAG: hypothetical protein R2851_24040 [Caldilineaceae bacterium]
MLPPAFGQGQQFGVGRASGAGISYIANNVALGTAVNSAAHA